MAFVGNNHYIQKERIEFENYLNRHPALSLTLLDCTDLATSPAPPTFSIQGTTSNFHVIPYLTSTLQTAAGQCNPNEMRAKDFVDGPRPNYFLVRSTQKPSNLMTHEMQGSSLSQYSKSSGKSINKTVYTFGTVSALKPSILQADEPIS